MCVCVSGGGGTDSTMKSVSVNWQVLGSWKVLLSHIGILAVTTHLALLCLTCLSVQR